MKVQTHWQGMPTNVARVSDNYFGPTSVEVSVTGAEFGHDVDLTLTFQAGRYVVQKLTVCQVDGGDPVDTESLRRVPITAIVRMAKEGVFQFLMEATDEGDHTKLEPLGWKPNPDLAADGPTDAALQHVATTYRLAYALSEPPTAWVAERLGLTRATAKRWVGLARDKGYLGLAEERKAGEV